MFYRDGILFRSDLLTGSRIRHGFSTREGGVSVFPHTRSMNLGHGLGDSQEIVYQNADIFAKTLSDGIYGAESVVITSQIHSAKVRFLSAANCGEGTVLPVGESCDGFVTDCPGVMPIVRTADCTPILLAGSTGDGRPVIGAVHAGWKGSAAGIAAVAVGYMTELGAELSTIRVAVGAHIEVCCYEVGADMVEQVAATAGADFAGKFCTPRGKNGAGEEKFTADLTGMNCFHLQYCGISPEQIDISSECTMCHPDLYHSHRATGGKRGTMGAGIVIMPEM
ncbi:MAG: laccase domain-containing protein [Clostridia bacterium]|nr:laccase domain-containing protein [Clostridia bacterium]